MSKITNQIKSHHKRKRMYITVYSTVRRYGGPEEGGWWYNQSIVVDYKRANNIVEGRKIARIFREKYPDIGDIYSVNGGEYFDVYTEKKLGTYTRNLTRPYYC
jgi:hypothetical protein